MIMKRFTQSLLTTAIIASLAGCAANSGGMANASNGDECSAVKSGAAGMLIGAALGAAINGQKGATQGAVAGAAIGAVTCISMNVKSQKVRDAQAVNEEYRQRNRNLPEQPVVTAYNLQAPRQAVRGNAVTINSAMTVVDGAAEPASKIEEKLFIVDADGRRNLIKSKTPDGMNGGGEYANTFTIPHLKDDLKQGNYRLDSELYVNEKLAKTASSQMMIAYDSNGVMQVAMK